MGAIKRGSTLSDFEKDIWTHFQSGKKLGGRKDQLEAEIRALKKNLSPEKYASFWEDVTDSTLFAKRDSIDYLSWKIYFHSFLSFYPIYLKYQSGNYASFVQQKMVLGFLGLNHYSHYSVINDDLLNDMRKFVDEKITAESPFYYHAKKAVFDLEDEKLTRMRELSTQEMETPNFKSLDRSGKNILRFEPDKLHPDAILGYLKDLVWYSSFIDTNYTVVLDKISKVKEFKPDDEYFQFYVNRAIRHIQYLNRDNRYIKMNVPAPDFSFTDLNGTEMALSSYKGKVIYLVFWRRWMFTERLHLLKELHEKFKDKDFVLLGVALENIEDERKYCQKNNIPWIQVIPEKGKKADIAELYTIHDLPKGCIIDKTGMLREKVNLGDELLEQKIQRLLDNN